MDEINDLDIMVETREELLSRLQRMCRQEGGDHKVDVICRRIRKLRKDIIVTHLGSPGSWRLDPVFKEGPYE